MCDLLESGVVPDARQETAATLDGGKRSKAAIARRRQSLEGGNRSKAAKLEGGGDASVAVDDLQVLLGRRGRHPAVHDADPHP